MNHPPFRSVPWFRHLSVPLLCAAFAWPALGQVSVRLNGLEPSTSAERMVYDSVRDRVVAYTGQQVYEHDGSTWQLITTNTTPPPRYEYAMVFDGVRTLLYGGMELNGPNALGDFWAYDGTDWTQIPMPGLNPGPRRACSMAHDLVRNRVVLFGGTDMLGGFPNDTWEWDGQAWSLFPGPGPTARISHEMAYDPIAGVIVLAGGALFPGVYTDTWEFDGTQWLQTQLSQLPGKVQCGGMVYDTSIRRCVLFGGHDGSGSFSPSVWTYDAAMNVWAEVPMAGFGGLDVLAGAAFDSNRQRTITIQADFNTSPPETWLHSLTAQPGGGGTLFGTSCAPAGASVPQISLAPGSALLPGSTAEVLATGMGTSSRAVLLLGLSNTSWAGLPLPIKLGIFTPASGCDLLVSVDSIRGTVVDGRSQSASFSVPVPNQGGLSGVSVYLQVLGLTPGGIIERSSQGLQITVP